MSELEIKANAEQYALKRIASTDLSKQARDKILIQDAYEKGFNDCYVMAREEYEKQIEELQEELKAKQVVLNDFKSRCETVTERFNKKSGELNQAKEIIREYLEWADWKGSNCPSFKNICEKAEAFLKE